MTGLRKLLLGILTAAMTAGAHASASAQSPGERTVTLALGGTATAPQLITATASGAIERDTSALTNVVVACGPIDCSQMRVDGGGTVGTVAAKDKFSFSVPKGGAASISIKLVLGTVAVTPTLQVNAAAAPSRGGQTQPDTTTDPEPSTSQLIRYKCSVTELPAVDGPYFVVWPDGTPVLMPASPPRDDQRITIFVQGDSVLVTERLSVRRASATRTLMLRNVFGGGAALPDVAGITRQGKETRPCAYRMFTLGDFAPGTGRFEIIAHDDKEPITSSVEFVVAATYTGALGFAMIRTEVVNPTFGKTFNGTDTVATLVDDDRPRILYALTYTPFVTGSRTMLPGEGGLRLSPMIGIVLNDVPNNALAGVGIDWSGYLHVDVGVHAGRVRRLDPRAGAALGDPFENRSAEVPTVRGWQFRPFVGVGIDIQSATALLQTALGTKKPATSP